MRKLTAVFLAVLLCFSCFGCNANQEKQANEALVHIYAAPNTIPEDILTAFTAQTGIQVKCSVLKNEDTAIKKLAMGMSPFDLIIADNLFMERAAQAGVLQSVNRSKAPGSAQLLNVEANEYILPYTRTCAVLLHNVVYTQAPVVSYASLWSPHMRGKLSLLPDARLMSAVALKSRGLSVNAAGDKELKAAQAALVELKPNVYSANNEMPGSEIAEGRSGLGVVWAKDAQDAYASNAALEILYPDEGAIVKMTCMGISATAKHTEETYRFIEYLLQPENCLKISKHLQEESLHTGVADLADAAYGEMFAVYMAAKYDEKTECLHYVATQENYTEIWDAFLKTEEKKEEAEE